MLDEIQQLSSDNKTGPTESEIGIALKQALQQGARSAVATLSKTDGFNGNDLVRIKLPQELQKAEEVLRKFGQDKYVDRFITTMNRAAEQATPQAQDILLNSIKQLSLRDVINIIQGPDDAATRYFRRTSEQQIQNSFRPIVSKATNQVKLTKSYKKLIKKASLLNRYISDDAKDLDGYITRKTSDALFIYIAKEEQLIRQNPIARTTEILRKVFAYYQSTN